MNRAFDGSGPMLMVRQYVDDLAALGNDFQNFAMIDDTHQPTLLFGRETCMSRKSA